MQFAGASAQDDAQATTSPGAAAHDGSAL